MERHWANPSSTHRAGQGVRHAVEKARADVAGLIGVRAREVVFTSGGTESINLAIRGVILRGRTPSAAEAPPAVISSGVEHAAVRGVLEDLAKVGLVRVLLAPVGREGVIDLARFEEMLVVSRPVLASVQWANNETGAIQPIEAIWRACQSRGVQLHCDGVQWVGKMPVASPPCDLLSLSAHKFHGPKGIGALWVRPGLILTPTLHGTQELGRRGGTENVPGVLGAGAAARAAIAWLADETARASLAARRDAFEQAILVGCPGSHNNGPTTGRLWNTTNIAFPGIDAQALLMMLSERGVCASAGAACSSGSIEPSPTLLAMGLEERVVNGSVRFSLSRETTAEELDTAVGIISDCVRKLSPTIAGMTNA